MHKCEHSLHPVIIWLVWIFTLYEEEETEQHQAVKQTSSEEEECYELLCGESKPALQADLTLTESDPGSSSLQKLKPVTAVLGGGKTSDLIDNHIICVHKECLLSNMTSISSCTLPSTLLSRI